MSLSSTESENLRQERTVRGNIAFFERVKVFCLANFNVAGSEVLFEGASKCE